MGKTKKIIYIIPGFRQKPTSKAYKAVVTVFKKEGFVPIPVYIPWKQSTISENTDYFLKEYRKTKYKNKYIFGFSFGAMIAFAASAKVSSLGLVLCSLSPYFKEDISTSTLRSTTLAKKIKAKQILMLYGTKEARPLVKRVINVYKRMPSNHKHLISIKKGEHDIGSKRYLHAIHKVTQQLH